MTEPYYFVVMNIKGMGMMFSGELDVRESLSGPDKDCKICRRCSILSRNIGFYPFNGANIHNSYGNEFTAYTGS